MTPGLALFYGGMVRAKSVLNMMMMSFGALALISVLWVLYGYSEAFGNDVGGGLLGNPFEFFGLSKLLGTNGVDNGFQSEHLVFTIPALAFVAFQSVFAIITVAACLGWLATERIRDGHATSLGAASGVVAGLVAITPSCSSVTPIGAIFVGLIAGVLCAMAVGLKYRLGYDDSLDVVGVHLVGGLWGTLAVGLFASAATTAGVNGLFYGGGLDQLWRQAVGAFAVLFYSFFATLLIGWLVHKTMGFRISEEAE